MRVIFHLLRPSFETEGAVLGTARCQPEDPLDMEVLSSVRGHVLDVLDGALDTATDPPLTPEPLIKSAVSIRPRADPEFFLGGGALFSSSTSTPINHIVLFFFFCRIPVVLENRRSSQGECAPPAPSP